MIICIDGWLILKSVRLLCEGTMANDNSHNRALAVLEYAKAFIWPLLIVTLLIVFNSDIHKIIEGGGWSVGPVKVEQRVNVMANAIQNQFIAQKDLATKIQENPGDTAKVKEYADKLIENIKTSQQGLTKDIDQLKAVIPAQQSGSNEQGPPTKDKPATAQDWELKGFDALVAKDVDTAIDSFAQAESIWPQYHNVAEIRSLLVSKREALKDPKSAEWKAIHSRILSDYSWGMPPNVREKLKAGT